jgi:exosortase A-associated hydrolase 2
MNSGKCSIKADFLEHQGKKLFYLLLGPAEVEARGSVLFLPPFTEEMHKSRHLVASQARAIAASGYNVLLLDLSGCGDSGGDFADASWQVWLQDATAAANTLMSLGAGHLTVWGLRLGALLACELSRSRSDVEKLILWQPTLNGEQQIDQFLRLRTVSSIVDNQKSFDRKALWNELRSGNSLEIAGYELSSRMALGMAKARLIDVLPDCPVHWMEIGNSRNRKLSTASENVIRHWREQGGKIETTSLQGEPFWRIAEAGINTDLQHNTTELFAES